MSDGSVGSKSESGPVSTGFGVNLAQYFADLRAKNEADMKQAEAQKQEAWESVQRAESEVRALTAERAKKLGLRAQNAAEGLDTVTLDEKIKDLDQRIWDLTGQVAVLRKQHKETGIPPCSSTHRWDLLVETLKQYGVLDAVEVGGIQGIIGALPVAENHTPRGAYDRDDYLCRKLGIELDPTGRPIRCSFSTLTDEFRVLEITPSDKHFFKNYRPRSLRWLPLEDQEKRPSEEKVEAPERAKVQVFLDRSSAKLFLTKTKLRRSVATGKQVFNGSSWEQSYETVEEDFSDVGISVQQEVEKLFQQAKGSLDLRETYADNPLLAHVRAKLIPLTTTEPLFPPNDELLGSGEVYRRIKSEWDAFVAAPWSDAIEGDLALLKYHLENGEKPRFWSAAFQNNYGFRLRTRDHDWVKGQIYLGPETQSSSGEPSIIVCSKPENVGGIVARVSRMSLLVSRSED